MKVSSQSEKLGSKEFFNLAEKMKQEAKVRN